MKKQTSSWDYLWYALYAFAGIGLEIVLISFIEPLFLENITTSGTTQNIIHWLLTSLCWGVVALVLIKTARNNLNFDIINNNQVSSKSIVVSLGLVIICILMNYFNNGSFKVISEFKNMTLLEFVFQHVYYIFEMGLVYLIVAFGQQFGEAILNRKTNIPLGGFFLALTWGSVHMLTQSITTGLVGIIFSLMYGIMYVVLNRNPKMSFITMFMGFVI